MRAVMVLLLGLGSIPFMALGAQKKAASPPTPVIEPAEPGPLVLDLDVEAKLQWTEIERQIAGRATQPPVAECVRPDALIIEADRDSLDVLLRRTQALLDHLQNRLAVRTLSSLEAELGKYRAEGEKEPPKIESKMVSKGRSQVPVTAVLNQEARFKIFSKVFGLRRSISLARRFGTPNYLKSGLSGGLLGRS